MIGVIPDPLAEARFQRACICLHRLGPRVLAEFLAELAAERIARHLIEEKIATYAGRLSPEMLAGVGGDRFPAFPVHAISGGKR